MRTFFTRSWLVGLLLLPFVRETDAAPPRSDPFGADPVEAYKAIEKAGEAKDPAVAGDLLEAGVETTWAHLAVACGDALAAIGPKAAENADYQKVLTKVLRTREPRQMTNLSRVLAAYGDASVDETLAGLCTGRRSPEMLAEALFLAGGLKPTKDAPFYKTIGAIGSGLRSKYPAVVAAACSAAGRIKDESFTDLLEPIVRKSQDRYAGLFAVAALARMGVKGKVSAYIHVLDGEVKPETTAACLKAVTDLAAPDDAEDLLSMMRATKKEFREAACISFGLMALHRKMFVAGSPSTTSQTGSAMNERIVSRLLQIVSEDPDWEVRDAAVRTLGRIGEVAKPMVETKVPMLVGTFDRDVGLAGIALAGRFGVKDVYRELMKISTVEKDPTQRMAAARALSTIDPDAAIAEWKEGPLKDRKGRGETLNMIRAMGYVRTEKAFTTLLEYFDMRERWSEEILAEVERALERITGHRFGRKPERWMAWYAAAKARDPFHPRMKRVDRTKNRREAVEKHLYGLTEATERSVEAALRWLERQQDVVGMWDGTARGYGGVIASEPAYTGLCVLALLGAGYTPTSGKFRETIRRGAEWLSTTQTYDGGFPVTGRFSFSYLNGMGIWGILEACAIAPDDALRLSSQRGCDFFVRVQTPGGGYRYGARDIQNDTSCTSWGLKCLKSGEMLGLEVPENAIDGIDAWLEKCQQDVTGEEEMPEDMSSAYDKEVGVKRLVRATTSYSELAAKDPEGGRPASMTPLGMICRFFMGWQRSHPFMIGSANFMLDYLPQWRKGLEKGVLIAWYFYFYYYGTLAMYQMGGRYWRAWNDRTIQVLPPNQRREPEELAGSWDPDTAILSGGRIFSTAMGCLTLESYYRFSPLVGETEEEIRAAERRAKAGAPAGGGATDAGGAMGEGSGAGMEGR